MYISDITTAAPSDERCPLETKVYEELAGLGIEYERVDNDSVEAMEECIEIQNKLGAEIRKTVVACNRQKTDYYLVVLPAEKRFDSKAFAKAMECSRLSFASGDDMVEKLGVAPGSATVMSVLNDGDNLVKVAIDKEVADEEWFACNPGANTTHLKFRTADLIEKFLPACGHEPTIVEL
ncbi:MAG: prolyl-tRNA synthetase associated domain-containing protein [Clostridiales bacterium]|nr:prolyl-tRNA synthetase associated domain-containing protein [Candidatus Crickella merdequi]